MHNICKNKNLCAGYMFCIFSKQFSTRGFMSLLLGVPLPMSIIFINHLVSLSRGPPSWSCWRSALCRSFSASSGTVPSASVSGTDVHPTGSSPRGCTGCWAGQYPAAGDRWPVPVKRHHTRPKHRTERKDSNQVGGSKTRAELNSPRPDDRGVSVALLQFPTVPFSNTYHDFEFFVQIFARCCKRFRRGVLKIPQLVLHPAVEFVRILLPLQMELDTDGGILG